METVLYRQELLARAVKALETRGCEVYVASSAEETAAKIAALVQDGVVGLFPDPKFLEMGILGELVKQGVAFERLDREGFAQEHEMASAPLADLRQAIRERTAQVSYGITGVDAVIANHGTLMILDEEGCRHSLSTLPYTHIALAGVEQIVPDLPDAMGVARRLSATNTKGLLTRYISLVSGPSSTSDVQGQNVRGMHGPKEVKVILLDTAKTKEEME